jgi:ABC-type Fe3+/spermidine/putrescine transport system ATPase subunit
MASVVLDDVAKAFGEVVAVDGISLEIADGEFFSMLGPSGSGKTTCLRMIAGFEEPDRGRVLLHGRDVTGLPPYDRDVNTVFQDYALFPHMTVAQNVGYGPMVRKQAEAERSERVARALAMVHLEAFGDRKPSQLSGGQRQRVALARALINRPKVLLLDEPLGALDLKLRQAMQLELKTLQREVGITFIYVTHDQEEALSLADTIVVMNDGCVQQVATSRELYAHPINRFVAGFIGTPPMNFLAATVQSSVNGHVAESPFTVVTPGFSLPLPARVISSGVRDRSRLVPGVALTLGVRPEDLIVGPPAGVDGPRGRVVVVEPQGDERIVSVALSDGDSAQAVWKVRAPKYGPGANVTVGDSVGLTVRPRGLRLFDQETEERVL